jgi:hypothetical protein
VTRAHLREDMAQSGIGRQTNYNREVSTGSIVDSNINAHRHILYSTLEEEGRLRDGEQW